MLLDVLILLKGFVLICDPKQFSPDIILDDRVDIELLYLILKDFESYAEAQRKVEAAYKDEKSWARSAILNTACSGKFTSDRTIQEYVKEIWTLDKVTLRRK